MPTGPAAQSRVERRFAAWYDRMNAGVERRWAGARRAALVAGLTGRVLDLGAGTGANLPHFRAAGQVSAVEPSAAMRERLTAKLGRAHVPVQVVDAAAEVLPFPDGYFDAVVCTLVLCTVPDQARALAEIRRVLRPGGQLAFLEHVRATGAAARAQDLLAPLVHYLGAGCHPNCDTLAALAAAGFTVQAVETFKPVPRIPLIAPFVAGTAVAPPG
ncbi:MULTISPECIES: class I SAM-dependent methyltransferase [Streptomycetaceae]|uniref:Methylase involved in ubiquinone/menaquinone biosynthesis n=1 Tax=Streptantibioticus cattleyicolor (strain ATCC 35852 / DSM 46488 / JCM 4925 / NBRC 14057 / NRRL 8057) TaxID=1003195 RepID=F8K4F1_STREN|nr:MULTISPECIES: class I SAM-dependent methyltransferase [Streptomycetaceae]AEW95106.1 methylase involved in ubiquinone/menaquinone biosynthesis [Streptantibioticus cattleyicolor NRRL 8057 = DSM 46488]MYS59695.1 methyltransferase domain-containing protein [Streptomyces sp. SID5468]CCB75452.1 Methylase involved in ubiquinone/menaquinone biosynthesis [Streptantibioticus cattleyicolor NRRL 8057 = DSM 46488]